MTTSDSTSDTVSRGHIYSLRTRRQLCQTDRVNSDFDAQLRRIATECVKLVDTDFRRQLDWSVDSLGVLDDVCAELLADESLQGDRFDLWWKLVGAYVGQVVVDAYNGRWIEHGQEPGAYAVTVYGIVGFPFGVAKRVLSGEPFKSLASFARSLPVIAQR